MRNYSIDILKLYFAVCIALGHANWLRTGFGSSVPSINSGMIVLLFFLLSGFFLVKSFDSHKYTDSWHYTMARLRRIYKYYIIAFMMLFIYSNQQLLRAPWDFFEKLSKSLPELFLLQNIGIFDGGLNYPLWQMSCLIVASHVLFGLMSWNRQATIDVICPVLIICTFTALANVYGGGSVDGWGVEGKFIYIPLLRAIGSIAIGMVAYTPMTRLLRCLEQKQSKYVSVITFILSLLAFVALWNNRNSYAIVFPFIAILLFMLYPQGIYAKLFKWPILSKLEGLSLAVYYTHALTIQVFNKNRFFWEALSPLVADMLYVGVVFVISIALLIITDGLSILVKKTLTVRQIWRMNQ